jgi:hypothetical protein
MYHSLSTLFLTVAISYLAPSPSRKLQRGTSLALNTTNNHCTLIAIDGRGREWYGEEVCIVVSRSGTSIYGGPIDIDTSQKNAG